MNWLNEIKVTKFSHFINQISQKQANNDTYIQFDKVLNDILEIINIKYSKEKNPQKIEAILFLANTIEKIQYLCWCHALKFHNIKYPQNKTFLCTSTNLFLNCHTINDFKFDTTIFPLDTLHNMLHWAMSLVQIARSIFPSMEHEKFQKIFFKSNNARQNFINFYFS